MSFRTKYQDFFEKHYRIDDFLFATRIWKFLTMLRSMKGLIRYHPNRLYIKTLGRGWTDCDEQLLHASMQILVNFVEKEKWADTVDWEADKDHRKASRTMDRLYYWWKYDPFAQDRWRMPNHSMKEVYENPLGKIEKWVDESYKDWLEPQKNVWAKKIIKEVEKSSSSFEFPDYYDTKEKRNELLYYHCLNLIEQEAIKRQNKALKDLINIRGYLWT